LRSADQNDTKKIIFSEKKKNFWVCDKLFVFMGKAQKANFNCLVSCAIIEFVMAC
jgi:hypothetical protein